MKKKILLALLFTFGWTPTVLPTIKPNRSFWGDCCARATEAFEGLKKTCEEYYDEYQKSVAAEDAARVAAEKKAAAEKEKIRLAAEKKKAAEEAVRVAAEKEKAAEQEKARLAAEKKAFEDAEERRIAQLQKGRLGKGTNTRSLTSNSFITERAEKRAIAKDRQMRREEEHKKVETAQSEGLVEKTLIVVGQVQDNLEKYQEKNRLQSRLEKARATQRVAQCFYQSNEGLVEDFRKYNSLNKKIEEEQRKLDSVQKGEKTGWEFFGSNPEKKIKGCKEKLEEYLKIKGKLEHEFVSMYKSGDFPGKRVYCHGNGDILKASVQSLENFCTEMEDSVQGATDNVEELSRKVDSLGSVYLDKEYKRLATAHQQLQKIASNPYVGSGVQKEAKRVKTQVVHSAKKIIDTAVDITERKIASGDTGWKQMEEDLSHIEPFFGGDLNSEVASSRERFKAVKEKVLLSNPNRVAYRWLGVNFRPIDIIAWGLNKSVVPLVSGGYKATTGAIPAAASWAGNMGSTWSELVQQGHAVKSTCDVAVAGAGSLLFLSFLKQAFNKHRESESLLGKAVSIGRAFTDKDLLAGLVFTLVGSTAHLQVYDMERKRGRYSEDMTGVDVAARTVSVASLAAAYDFYKKVKAKNHHAEEDAVPGNPNAGQRSIKQMFKDLVAAIGNKFSEAT